MKTIQTNIIFTLLASCLFFLGSTDGDGHKDNPIKVNWSDLADVEWVWEGNFYLAKFNDKAKELEGKEVIVEGFMFPLEYTRRHTNFLISSSPMSHCYFCGPGEAESMIYVESNEPLEYNTRTLKMQGTFKLVSDASMGIIYELKDAVPVR